jgi:hypothetical protein
VAGVQNELFIVKDTPHFGVMFDSDEGKNMVISFLRLKLSKMNFSTDQKEKNDRSDHFR